MWYETYCVGFWTGNPKRYYCGEENRHFQAPKGDISGETSYAASRGLLFLDLTTLTQNCYEIDPPTRIFTAIDGPLMNLTIRLFKMPGIDNLGFYESGKFYRL